MLRRSLLAMCVVAVASVAQAADVNVGMSISVGEPGFFGRLDIGNFPPPVLVYPTPVVVRPVPVARPPLYLHVPPGHARNWKRFCARYDACGQPVYFVQDRWYEQVYVPQYQERRRGHGNKHDRDDDRGEGHGHGHGHDRD